MFGIKKNSKKYDIPEVGQFEIRYLKKLSIFTFYDVPEDGYYGIYDGATVTEGRESVKETEDSLRKYIFREILPKIKKELNKEPAKLIAIRKNLEKYLHDTQEAELKKYLGEI